MSRKAARPARASAPPSAAAARNARQGGPSARSSSAAASTRSASTSERSTRSAGSAAADVAAGPVEASQARRIWRRLRGIHPGLVLAFLDAIGFCIALYLSSVELQGGVPNCIVGHGCESVARSPYSRPFFNIPVAVYGVFLSLTLFSLAIAWWRTNRYSLLLWHYGLSLVGVLFEGWFQFAQFFLIRDFCVWCESYGISLILRFLIALWVYLRTPKPGATVTARA